MSAPTGYSRTQVLLHWAVMVLVVLQFLFHEGIAQAFDRGLEGSGFVLTGSAIAHFAVGSLLLLLTMWRFAIRMERGVPPPEEKEPPALQAVAHGVHLAFYALLVLLPVTGGLAWGMQSEGLGNAHEVLRAVLLLLILAHLAGAIYQAAVLKSDALRRITRPQD